MTSMAGRARRSSRAPLALEQLAAVQRGRIVAAMARMACEHGAANVTVADVIGAAGVSRRTFYELFSSREECLLAALDDAIERIARRVVPVWRGDGAWQERVRAALVEILSFCEESPLAARIVFVEAQAGGPATMARRGEIQARAMAAVEEGRKAKREAVAAGPLTPETIVGGVGSIVSARVAAAARDGKRPDLLGLTSALTSTIVLPYLGAAAARKEAGRPAPKRASKVESRDDGAASMGDLDMRLTYRRLRVVLAVAEHPGGSNRLIGDSAGIGDQGQISKLLARLELIGVVENARDRSQRGAPNAWTLTDKGKRIAANVRAHTGEIGAGVSSSG